MVPLLGTPCANSGVKDTFIYLIEDSLLSSSNLAPTQWQPDVYLLAEVGIFTAISDQTKRNKIPKNSCWSFPKKLPNQLF